MADDPWDAKRKAILHAAHVCAVNAQQWAIKNHPWKNRTGDAESNLAYFVVDNDKRIAWGVAQGVDYGKYLETDNDGKYGVTEKAVDHFAPDFKAMLDDIMKG
jgi:hypothetical protein